MYPAIGFLLIINKEEVAILSKALEEFVEVENEDSEVPEEDTSSLLHIFGWKAIESSENAAPTIVDAVTAVSERAIHVHEMVAHRQRAQGGVLQRLRGDKALIGKKHTMKTVYDEIAKLMLKPLGEHVVQYNMTGYQSKGLYATLKTAHDKYCTKSSGSDAGAPPPDM
jgi:hypothetical protein